MAPREEEGPGEGALELCAEEGGIDEAPPRRRERPEGAVDILGRLGRFSGGGDQGKRREGVQRTRE